MTDKPSAPSSDVDILPRELPEVSPQRDMVLKFLDSEISLLTQRQKNSGWTSWALVGAIGAIAWALLGQWEAGWPAGEKWILSYVAITLAGYAWLAIVGVLKGVSSRPGGITRFHLGIQKNSRAALAFGFAQMTILGVLIFWSGSFSSPTRYVAGTVMSLGGAMMLMTLFLSFTQIPIEAAPSDARVKLRYKAIGVSLGLSIVLVPALMVGWDLFGLAPTALDIKVGGLFAAASFLIRAWLDEVSSQPLMDNLLVIRRELAMGGMSVEEASRHVEIEFLGMRVSDVFRESAQEFIKHAARISARCKECIARIDAIGSIGPGGAGVPVSLVSQQVLMAQTLFEAQQPHFAAVVEELNQLEAEFKRIKSRGRFFLRSKGDAQAAMHDILARLSESHFEAYGSYQELEQRMKKLSTIATAPVASHKEGPA